MFDYARLRVEDDILGNIGRKVGHTLKVAADTDKLQTGFNRLFVRFDCLNNHLRHLSIDLIDLVVAFRSILRFQNGTSRLRVFPVSSQS